MATYLKRTSKLFDLTLPQSSSEMNLRDLICPVCRGILIEPVTLPCTHNLCLRCLKGTFEHNSLSCPLCRVRVGSWLRTASKSSSLVNNDLWDYIRSRYPKEIEGKNIDDVPEIHNQDDYVPKLLSAPGEIRREYQLQLQKASEEMCKQRENERIANEEFIRKIQHEDEKEKLAQLAQDQLLARSLAKKQLIDKQKTIKYYNDYLNNSSSRETKILTSNERLPSTIIESKTVSTNLNHDNVIYYKDKESLELKKSNLNIVTKIQPERIINEIKPIILGKSQDIKTCCDHSTSLQGFISVKNQALMMQKGFKLHSEPSCSKIYAQRTGEELNVSSNVLVSGKKNIEFVQVMTSSEEKKIESPQSAGSHDSINPEIHHFKPIKPLPRTPLKFSQDGRQIDFKVIRVLPVLKKIFNPILKAPASGSMKRITRCSWSAFKGKTQQDLINSQSTNSSKICENYLSTIDASKKADFITDLLCDTNKNCTKNSHRLVNGAKMNKKSACNDAIKAEKSNKSQNLVKNGAWTNNNESDNIKMKNSIKEMDECLTILPENKADSVAMCSTKLPEYRKINNNDKHDDNNDGFGTIENIAERIKRRKLACDDNKKIQVISESVKKPKRSRNLIKKNSKKITEIFIDDKKKSNKPKRKEALEALTKVKRAKKIKASDKNKKSILNNKKTRVTKNLIKSAKIDNNFDNNFNDERVIEEQEHMERILLQEKQDYELAQRLQAEFNEMERISGRTRGSRRALERTTVEVSVEKSKVDDEISKNQIITTENMVKGRRRRCN